MDVMKTSVDAELERLIEKRATVDDPEARDELWKASVRRYRAREQKEIRAAWYGWHLDQAERHRRTLEDLITHHETQAARLCEEGA